MKKVLALLPFLVIGSCQPGGGGQGRPRGAQDEEILFVTYSAGCKDGDIENWVVAIFQGGMEEMLASAKAVSVDVGATSMEAKTTTGAAAVDTTRGSEEASQEVFWRFVPARSTSREAVGATTATAAETEASRKEATGATSETDVARKSERILAEQQLIMALIQRGVSLRELQQTALVAALHQLFHSLVLEQFTKGELVLAGAQLYALLQGTDLKMIESEQLKNVWAVSQQISVLKVEKTVVQAPEFADLAKAAGKEGARVVTYSIKVKNISKGYLTGVTLVDRLPDKLDLDRAWMSDSMLKLASADRRTAVEIVRQEKDTIMLWNLQEAMQPGAEITLTFGAIVK